MNKMYKGLAVCAFCGLLGLPAAAQQDPHSNVFMGGTKPDKSKAAKTRSVKGTVTDVNGQPLPHALVTLTNEDSHVKLTFITKEDGRYNFDDLSFTTDYKLIAQYKTGRSPERTLSQYDHTPNVVRILTVDEPDSAPSAADTQSAQKKQQ